MRYKVTLIIKDNSNQADVYPLSDYLEEEVFPVMEDIDFVIESKSVEKLND